MKTAEDCRRLKSSTALLEKSIEIRGFAPFRGNPYILFPFVWENGQSYPDITLLPQLAAFFNISIDELIEYEPQMTRTEIRKAYRRLSAEFAVRPFEEVRNDCRRMIKKYFSCFPLLFQIGVLFLNYHTAAGDPDKTAEVIEEAKELFVRVKNDSGDIELAKRALNMEALCLQLLGRPEEVLELFRETNLVQTSPEALLASAYRSTGKTEEGKKILQVGIYQYLLGVFNLSASYLQLCADDSAAFEETYRRARAIAEAFQLKTLQPTTLMTFYILAAQGYVSFGNTNKGLELLEEYSALASGELFPLRLHGDSYFNLIDDWLEKQLDLGTEPPRDEKSIRQSIIDAVTENPAFAVLIDEPRFQAVVRRLINKKEG
ncbi:MAG: helix-turn-helix domain-containing protein [Clostridia bacterium]